MLEEFTSAQPGWEDFLKASMTQLLLFSVRRGEPAKNLPSNDPDATQQAIAKVAAYINTHYAEDITLKAVAQQFFISPCYLSRTFKRITGLPFSEYLNGVRIKEAQRLLHQSDHSISRIAMDVGFNNCTHFDRVFKHAVGVSPGVYRKYNHSL
jgi:YesN/AraC family two-component response regulator